VALSVATGSKGAHGPPWTGGRGQLPPWTVPGRARLTPSKGPSMATSRCTAGAVYCPETLVQRLVGPVVVCSGAVSLTGLQGAPSRKCRAACRPTPRQLVVELLHLAVHFADEGRRTTAACAEVCDAQPVMCGRLGRGTRMHCRSRWGRVRQ